MNENRVRRRRHTFPVTRRQSYDHTLYVREIYKSYILPETTEPGEIDEQVSVPAIIQSLETKQANIVERGGEPSHSCLNSRPYKPATVSSANRLSRPQSRDDHNRSRSSSPFYRIIGKEVTDNFLFSDNITAPI
ncbi:hypothetical protein RclHR1_06870003 [Rhizophagus clarus]|uniref:Uncharacterized protein n=1 Tax=Rhizophagus clarus TaxID=94130 RepID=A0A2Z6SB95_9GLOM|nr:hypothetical protein RclHR1_06870003 [Rhizophagus clarus]GES84822.1 hypothetical protein RCL_jg24170.t1 [Rhizophagus clarus]